MAQPKEDTEVEMMETVTANDENLSPPDAKAGAPLMRSKEDDHDVWQTVRRYKRAGLIAMAAAFCASLDGYRKEILQIRRVHRADQR